MRGIQGPFDREGGFFMELLTPEEFSVSELSPAQARLSRIVLRLHRCDPLDQIDSLFLAESLKNILLGHDPKKALGIGGKQEGGRRKKSFREVEKTEIFPVIEVATLMRMDGISWDAAFKKIANKYKINLSTLKRHYTKHREREGAS